MFHETVLKMTEAHYVMIAKLNLHQVKDFVITNHYSNVT